MKRIISLMLVAMLMVGALSTMAFAEGGVRTGTIYVTVSGNQFSSFGGRISVDNGATITGISGVVGSTSGKVGYANGENKNVGAVTITVSISVPDSFCGTVTAGFSQEEGKQVQFNEDGTVAGYIDVALSGGGSTTFEHSWGDWTETAGKDCLTHGTKTRTCSICGAVDSQEGEVGAHVPSTVWSQDGSYHWHECTLCGEVCEKDKHSWSPWTKVDPVETNEKGEVKWTQYCYVCKRVITDWKNPDVPPTGDATPYGAYNAVLFIAVAFTLCCTTGMIFKRKFVK